MRGQLAVLAALVVAFALPSVAEAAPPPNDAFATPETLSGASGTVVGSTVDATTEAGEPPSMPLNHSIWYAWTAPAYGNFSFNTGGTYAWIFTGDQLGALELKINGQGYGFVSVQPGVTYRIALDDWLPGGPTQLSWTFGERPPPPANDDWANAQPLTGTSGTEASDTRGATRESCDSAYAFRAPVWYAWTAPAAGPLTVASEGGTTVGVFTGSTQCSLVEHARSGGDPRYADVVAGQTYWIGVDDWTGSGSASFSWSYENVTRPVNDDFANALPLGPELRGEVTGTTRYATSEPGEWTPFFGRTVWYSFTPAESGLASVQVQLADVVTYSGNSIGSLTTVGYGNSTFAVTGGTTYHVQVSGGETFTLEWLLQPDLPPANDAFADAHALGGPSGRVEATNRLATLEPGEPDHGGQSGASVWFAWTAPANGAATFHVDSSFWTIHAVYVGDSVGSLTTVEQTRDVEAQTVTFTASAGTTYRIAVDGRAGGTGVFWLDWLLEEDGPTGTPPTPEPDTFVTSEDEPLVVFVDELLANDSDPDGDAFTFAGIASQPEGTGTVTLDKGGLRFEPAADFFGTASFSYRVVDATGLEATARVTVEVQPVNDAPTVTLSGEATEVAEGSPLALTAQAEDVDGDPVSFEWSASAGELTADGGTATLVVDDGPAAAIVQVVATDGAESSTAMQEVTVTNVAPTVAVQRAQGVWGLPITLRGSATDPSAADTAAGLSPAWSFGKTTVPAFVTTAAWDAPGSYPAPLRVTDKDGGARSRVVQVDVRKRRSALALTGQATAPFGFGMLAARFVDDVDAATSRLDGRSVGFTAGGSTFGASTAGGVASAPVAASLLPGTYAVEAIFGGDALYLPSSASGSLTVVNSVGKATGNVVLGGQSVAFSVVADGATVKGSLTAGSFIASRISAFGVSGSAAWFAGTADDGRAFAAYVEDNREPGVGADVVRLWVAGDALAGSGVVTDGNVQLHK